MTFDVARWLESIGLAQHEELFREQGFDAEGLADLTDEDLRELGINAMGHRKTLLREAQRLRPTKATLQQVDQLPPLPAAPSAQNVTRGRVFLSYGHDVACVALVQRIKRDLEQAGWEPWFDAQHIQPNDEWRQSITKGIGDSQHVLAFLSQHSMRKDGVCRQEVAIALGPARCSVFTVLVEPPAQVKPPLIISHRQWLDMQQWLSLGETDPAGQEALYQRSLREILRVLDDTQPFAGHIDDLQRWLQPLDSTADMVAAEQGFNGREWLLGDVGEMRSGGDGEANSELTGEVERWRTSGTANQVYWLAAEPGWGKSAVAARLAHAGRARVMAVHFCKHDRPITLNAQQVVRTLAFQMATQMGEYRELLVRRLREGLVIEGLNALELFQVLLAAPLTHVIAGGRGPHDRHLIVLDALDETLDERGHSDLLNLVAGEFGKLPKWLGLLVTSRPEAPVMLKLRAFGVQRFDATDPRNLQDVKAHAVQWLATLVLSPEHHEQALRAVKDASAGNFLYLRQLQEAVAQGVIAPSALTRADTLPQGLGQLYLQWFEKRFPDPRQYAEQQRPLLELILAAREPLPLDLVTALLGWGAYGQQRLDTLGTLCIVEGGRVSMFHKSLRDWLADANASGWSYCVRESEGHRRMADGLLEVLLAWRSKGSEVSARDGWQSLGADGEAYAMRHLPGHLQAAGRTDQRRDVLTDFAFAVRRLTAGAEQALLEDYRPERDLPISDPLRCWSECLHTTAHLLRRGSPPWPSQRILLQVALEHADQSAITRAAEAWLATGACGWPRWVRVGRPAAVCESPVLATLEGVAVGKSTNAQSDASTGRFTCLQGAWGEGDVLLGHSDGAISLRQTQTADLIWQSQGGGAGSCRSLSMEQDSGWFAALFARGNLQTRVADSGDVKWEAARLPSKALCVTVMPDGRLISGNMNGGLDLWDPASSDQPVTSFKAHDSAVVSLAIASGGVLLAAISESGDVSMWNLPNLNPADPLPGRPLTQVRHVAFSADGVRCAAVDDASTLRLWDLQTRDSPRVIPAAHAGKIYGLSITQDGSRVLTAGEDKRVRVWDTISGECKRVLEGHAFQVVAVDVSPDGSRAVSASLDGKLIVWNLRGKVEDDQSVARGAEITSILELADDESLGHFVTGHQDGLLRMWRQGPRGPEELRHWAAHPGKRVWQIARIPGSAHLVTAGWDGAVRVWNGVDGSCLREFPGEPLNAALRKADSAAVAPKLPPFYVATVSPDGRWLVTSAGNGRTLRIWDLPAVGDAEALSLDNGRLLQPGHAEGKRRDAHALSIRAVAFEADGLHMRVSDERGIVKRWNLATAEEAGPALDHYQACLDQGLVDARARQEAYALALSPDSRFLACGGASRAITVWDLQASSPACRLVLQGHLKGVTYLAYSEDGRRLISASWDDTVRMWDLGSRSETAIYHADGLSKAVLLADRWRMVLGTTLGELYTIKSMLGTDGARF